MSSCLPLDALPMIWHPDSASEKDEAGIGVPNQRRTTATCAVFYRPLHGTLLAGRVGALRGCWFLWPVRQPARSASPIGVGEAGFKPYKGVCHD